MCGQMSEVLIFGGTTEGRLLAEYCAENRIPAWISVVSEYGKELLPDCPWLRVARGAMDQAAMEKFIEEKRISLVIDATHPYAQNASGQIRAASLARKVRLVRCLRESESPAQSPVFFVPDVAAAVDFLEQTTGAVLVTTGSRELHSFARLTGYKERLYVRVLPSSEVLKQCELLGFSGKHLIAMQGPFSEEMNRALLRQTGVSWIVTKESGAAGGFAEKLAAAADCGVSAVVIARPEETGFSLSQVKEILKASLEAQEESGREIPECMDRCREKECSEKQERTVLLAGIGMGAPACMTWEVRTAILESPVILGAARMLEAAKTQCGKTACSKKEWITVYQQDKIVRLLELHPEWERVLVLYSGDTGFYSGAAGLSAELKKRGISFQIRPGISSVSYFASRLGISWEDAEILTAHGRELDVKAIMRRGRKKRFILMGGENGAGRLCQTLAKAGYGDLFVSVGENLSYPEERIRSGTAEELSRENFSSLSLVLVNLV